MRRSQIQTLYMYIVALWCLSPRGVRVHGGVCMCMVCVKCECPGIQIGYRADWPFKLIKRRGE